MLDPFTLPHVSHKELQWHHAPASTIGGTRQQHHCRFVLCRFVLCCVVVVMVSDEMPTGMPRGSHWKQPLVLLSSNRRPFEEPIESELFQKTDWRNVDI